MDFEQLIIHLEGVNLLSTIFRLGLATLFGGVIGAISEKKKRAAGFKTHILVCLGAALVMLTNQYIYINVSGSIGDPARMGAQVINGIGFLGAGTILVTGRQQIKGLTTAAGLWASACMGLAIGIGFYSGAIVSFSLILITITIFQKINNKVTKRSLVMDLYIEIETVREVKNIIKILKNEGCIIEDLDIQKSRYKENELIGVFISLLISQGQEHKYIISLIRECEGVSFIEEMI